MANSAAETLKEFKSASTAGNAVYATLKVQYTGSWMDDIQQISTMCGVPVQTLLQLNPWLTSNNFVANNHDYITIKITAGSPRTGGSNAQNSVTGFYSTNEWFHPLGVGLWYCSQAYSQKHSAIDLTTGTAGQIAGKPIYAVKAGTVVQSYSSTSWGYTVLIRHDDTKDADGNCYYTRYAHMEKLGPSIGTKVSQGDQVGTCGNTGTSTGAHLHFQIYFTSATRTDYTNFDGGKVSHTFSVNPNDIKDFPGIPYTDHHYSQVEMHKSPYVTDADIKVIQGAASEDGTVTQSQFDETVNGIANRIITAKNVDPSSDLAKLIKDYVKAQLDGIKTNAAGYATDILTTGDFSGVLSKFCSDVVNNSIWFVENKIDNLLQYAISVGQQAAQNEINQAKTQLKDWIVDITKIDRNSELGVHTLNLLDSYVDTIVADGWQAVTTALTTGDVKLAAGQFLEVTKRQSIDYVCELGSHALANAITSYIGSHSQSTELSQIAADLAPGIINTMCQSIGSVMKGDISIEQAAKNVLVQVVSTVATTVVRKYLVPVVSNWVVTGLTTLAVNIAGSQIGGQIGAAIAGPVGYIVGALASAGVSWVINSIFS